MNETETEQNWKCKSCEWLGIESETSIFFPPYRECPKCAGNNVHPVEKTPKPSAKVMQGPLEVEPRPTLYELCRRSNIKLDQLLQNQGETVWSPSLHSAIDAELHRAKSKFPDWPTDPIHAFAIVAEEFGEVAKEVLQLTYEPTKSTVERIRTETIQLAAMCHRFLESLDRYEFKPSAQHEQK